MPTEINGLPAHVLLVHVVVILVPLTALLLVVSAVWPALRRRIGVILPLLALVTLVSVPITTHAGEWLIKRVPRNPMIHKHASLADGLLPWAIGLFLVSVVLWALYRTVLATPASGIEQPDGDASVQATRRGVSPGLRLTAGVVVAVLAIVVSVGSVVEVYRIGDSGARAAWTGGFSQQPLSHSQH